MTSAKKKADILDSSARLLRAVKDIRDVAIWALVFGFVSAGFALAAFVVLLARIR